MDMPTFVLLNKILEYINIDLPFYVSEIFLTFPVLYIIPLNII